VSPRKSSTSSAEPVSRPRYLGVEVVGEPFVPRPWLEETLRRTLSIASPPPGAGVRRPRIIRLERSKALVEVGHRWASEARAAWNGPVTGPSGRPVALATRRTWGTLKDGKLWLRRPPGR
jgi:RNase P/RNase MRP subunit POP5